MDSANHFKVVLKDCRIVMIMEPVSFKELATAEALNLAAWLVAVAEPEAKEFHRVLAEIKTS